MRIMRWTRIPALIIALAFASSAIPAFGDCLIPAGDVDVDGESTVADVQCTALVALWGLEDQLISLPSCIGGQLASADRNWDEATEHIGLVADMLDRVSEALEQATRILKS